MFPRPMGFRLPEIWDGFAAWLFRCSNRKFFTASSGMQPPFVMDRLFALATRLHTSLFPPADPMTASRPAPRALALPAFAFPALVLPALALLMVAALVAVPNAARAQATPAATIENASSDVVLESYDDGALLAPYVSSGAGAIPAENAGTRMMWYPGKSAFRAGYVQSDQWNDSNIGGWSVAFGFSTTASGGASTAMGYSTIASGDQSTAMGLNTTASGTESTAMGEGTTASGDQSTAMGDNTTASGQYSTAMGLRTTASGEASTAMGFNTTASERASTAMGEGTTASGESSTAMGLYTTADSEESMAAGRRAAAEARISFVWNDGNGYHAIPNSSFNGLSSDKDVDGEPVTGSETFSVSARGGVRFITGGSSVTYIAGGSTGWSQTSTRSAKTDVTRADPTAVLEAVEAMPISTWEYKTESGEGAGTRHIGPMAEDFHGALPYDLGSSADHINSLNADGVALGAVKGLARKVERQKETIAALKAESKEKITTLKAESEEKIAALKAENRDIRAENRDIKKRLAALEADRSSALPAGLSGSWGLALLLGLGGLAGGSVLWKRRS